MSRSHASTIVHWHVAAAPFPHTAGVLPRAAVLRLPGSERVCGVAGWGSSAHVLLASYCELQCDANRILMECSILLQVNVGLNTSAMATNLDLQVGARYVNRVTAYNNAGLSAFADSPALVRCPIPPPGGFVCEFFASLMCVTTHLMLAVVGAALNPPWHYTSAPP